jgi:hypothetical protein
MSAWGYPVTLAVDAAFGMVSLAVLPWMGAVRNRRAAAEASPAAAS